MTDRATLEAQLAARVSELRAEADAVQAKADAIEATINRDYAFWTQPAYGNAAGRTFARSRDKQRAKIVKACGIASEAKALHDKAGSMERRGVVMAGDAAAARAAKIEALSVQIGQMVDTTHYGVRKVLKINAKTICVESPFGHLKVNKEFVRAIA